MGWRDKLTDGIGGVLAGGMDILTESFSKASRVVGPSTEAMRSSREPIPPEPGKEDPQALLYDPFALIDQLGYRDRPSGLTYQTLREMSRRVPTYTAILQTRINQVSSFAQRQKVKRDPGFGIVLRDSKKSPSRIARARMWELEEWLLQTGTPASQDKRNEHLSSMGRTLAATGRDNFRVFLRKLVRDSLELDQACHPAGTLIELEDGSLRSIESVSVGDSVQTHLGRFRPVIERMSRQYSGNFYTIRTGGMELTATAGHPLLVVDDPMLRFNPQSPKWVEASEVRVGHYLVYPKPEQASKRVSHSFKIFPSEGRRKYASVPYAEIAEAAAVHRCTAQQILSGKYQKSGPAVDRVKAAAKRLGFERNELPRPAIVCVDEQFAFLCGAYVAEGNVAGNAVQFTFGEDSGQVLAEKVRTALDCLGVGYSEYPYKGRRAFGIDAHSVDLSVFMKEHFRTGSSNKQIPDWIFNAEESIQREFLAAYLLGDGCFRGSGISFSTVSMSLFGGLRRLFAGFGVYARLATQPAKQYVYEDYQRNNSELYRANLSGKALRDLLQSSGYFDVVSPSRVRESYLQDDQYFYLKVSDVAVEIVEDFPVFNLEVSEDHSYIANGVVSHNCFEIQHNRKGLPWAFYAVDGATIRLADVPPGADGGFDPTQVKYVQVYDEVIISEFAAHQLCFGVRNPRTNIKVNGYGHSELEMLINVVTASLWGFEYNQRAFSNGSMVHGVLNFKGSVPDKKVDAFRRQWKMMIAGVSNAHRTPMTNVDELQWIDFGRNNRDMEFSSWMDWLVKVMSAVMQFDPAEINFNYGNTGQSNQMFSTPVDSKLKASKDRGLRPLLKDLAEWLNTHLIWQLDPELELEFLGLDAKNSDQAIDHAKKKSEYIMTVDELRAEEDLEPLPDDQGAVILNPVWLQAKQVSEGALPVDNAPKKLAQEADLDNEKDFDEFESNNRDSEKALLASDLRKGQKRAKVCVYEIEL